MTENVKLIRLRKNLLGKNPQCDAKRKPAKLGKVTENSEQINGKLRLAKKVAKPERNFEKLPTMVWWWLKVETLGPKQRYFAFSKIDFHTCKLQRKIVNCDDHSRRKLDFQILKNSRKSKHNPFRKPTLLYLKPTGKLCVFTEFWGKQCQTAASRKKSEIKRHFWKIVKNLYINIDSRNKLSNSQGIF